MSLTVLNVNDSGVILNELGDERLDGIKRFRIWSCVVYDENIDTMVSEDILKAIDTNMGVKECEIHRNLIASRYFAKIVPNVLYRAFRIKIIVQLCHYRLDRTLFLAIQLYDRCFYQLGEKISEIYPNVCHSIASKLLTGLAPNSSTSRIVELEIMNNLNYTLDTPTVFDFLERYSCHLSNPYIKELATYMCILSSFQWCMTRFLPSQIATAALYFAFGICKNTSFFLIGEKSLKDIAWLPYEVMRPIANFATIFVYHKLVENIKNPDFNHPAYFYKILPKEQIELSKVSVTRIYNFIKEFGCIWYADDLPTLEVNQQCKMGKLLILKKDLEKFLQSTDEKC